MIKKRWIRIKSLRSSCLMHLSTNTLSDYKFYKFETHPKKIDSFVSLRVSYNNDIISFSSTLEDHEIHESKTVARTDLDFDTLAHPWQGSFTPRNKRRNLPVPFIVERRRGRHRRVSGAPNPPFVNIAHLPYHTSLCIPYTVTRTRRKKAREKREHPNSFSTYLL